MSRIILAYHGVADYKDSKWIEYCSQKYDLKELSVRPDSFEKQLEYLRKNGYRSVSLKDFWNYRQEKIQLPKKCVAITFDDGFQNFFSFACPLLRKYGYTATVFLVTDKITSDDRNFLSWEEVFRLREEGFSFGAHTLSHPVLTSLPRELAEKEIKESKRIIEEKLRSSVEFFCYPYGEFNPEVSDLVKKAGFKGAVVTPSGPGIKEGAFSLKRVGINRNNSMLVFRFKVSGVFSWIREQKLLWRVIKAAQQ